MAKGKHRARAQIRNERREQERQERDRAEQEHLAARAHAAKIREAEASKKVHELTKIVNEPADPQIVRLGELSAERAKRLVDRCNRLENALKKAVRAVGKSLATCPETVPITAEQMAYLRAAHVVLGMKFESDEVTTARLLFESSETGQLVAEMVERSDEIRRACDALR